VIKVLNIPPKGKLKARKANPALIKGGPLKEGGFARKKALKGIRFGWKEGFGKPFP